LAKVFWDTNLFIYLLEENAEFVGRVEQLRRRMRERGDQLYTGTITVGEILVRPLHENRVDLQNRYQGFFRGPSIQLVPFDLSAALHYAHVRLDKTIRPADAIQLACAAAVGVDLFVTNDDRLSNKFVVGIQFITSLVMAPI
jgi:predicted nucleic acid-binding protein